MIYLKDLNNAQCFGQLIAAVKILKLFRYSGDWDELLGVVADGVDVLVEVHFERIQVSDVGLSAISNSANLKILYLVKTAECTNIGLMSVAEKCKLLRKLRIAAKCVALKKLCIKSCPVSDHGMEALAGGCPNPDDIEQGVGGDDIASSNSERSMSFKIRFGSFTERWASIGSKFWTNLGRNYAD